MGQHLEAEVGSATIWKNERCSNKPHGRRPPEKPGWAGHGGTPLAREKYEKENHSMQLRDTKGAGS